MICCNTKNNHYPFCVQLTGKKNDQLGLDSMLPSCGRVILDPDITKTTDFNDSKIQKITTPNIVGRQNSEDNLRTEKETTLPQLKMILHGRISDLERYGRTKNRLDLFRLFTDLLSVTIIGCDIHHTSIKTLVNNNKGKLDLILKIYMTDCNKSKSNGHWILMNKS